MLATALQKMIDSEQTNVTEVAELAGVSNSTVYRWIARRSEPSFDAIRRLIRGLPDSKAQEMLLATIITGTSFRVQNYNLDLDINEDGVVNSEDALDAAIKVVRGAGRSLTSVRAAAVAGKVRKDEVVQLIEELNEVIHHAALVQEVLILMVDKKRRRKAKPVR